LTEYLLSQQDAAELERARLELLQEKHDPLTIRQLDAIGVADGWRCLDVGAGGGSVTRMLAERVGPAGRVLALDIDTNLLDRLASDHVEVRRHDLLTDGLGPETFDLVHARLLLMHLPARLQALERLMSAVRPGGWFAAIDPDFTTVDVVPRTPAWERTWSSFLDALIAGGWDPRYGARLCDDLLAVGAGDVQADYLAHREPGGSLTSRLLSLTLERLRPRMLPLGASDQEIDAARSLLEDSASRVRTVTTCAVRARKPA